MATSAGLPPTWVRLPFNIKSDKKGQAKAAAMAAALGMSAAEWADCGSLELKGLELRIETRQWVGDDTKTRVSVDKFMPIERAGEPEKKPAARTPAQKIAKDKGEEAGEADDIPF
jgi:hypothetical protein